MSRFSKKDRQGIYIFTFLAVCVVGGASVALSGSGGKQLDDKGCPASVDRKTVFVIDRSDAATSQTTAEIMARFKSAVTNDIAVGEQVAVFFVNSEARSSLVPAFSACKPPSEGNFLYENARLVEKKFKENFADPITLAIDRKEGPSQASPIAEVITDLTVSEFLNGRVNRLVVFSDLLQHSENLSLYNCTSATWATQSYRESRVGAVERPKFSNTSISLHIVPREALNRDALKCRDGFWGWFFGDNEGESANLEVKYLPGGVV